MEGRQSTHCGDSWLQDTDLSLLFRESELLKRKVPGRTVQEKDRFGRACMHPCSVNPKSSEWSMKCQSPSSTENWLWVQ